MMTSGVSEEDRRAALKAGALVPEEVLLDELDDFTEEELEEVLAGLPDPAVESLIRALSGRGESAVLPGTPLEQALQRDPGYRVRDHLKYLSDRLAKAVRDVENGQSRYLRISMPPRSGKSNMTSMHFPTWILRRHSDWKIGLISHSDTLAVSWGREIRQSVEEFGDQWGIELARDSGGASRWRTTGGGEVTSRSTGQSITGLGFKVMLIDDAVKDFAAAHSEVQRNALWNWLTANAITRLEPPALVVVIGTRWHEDDLLGRLSSPEWEGDLDRWEHIEFPALAETADVLGREVGEPLISPLLDETPEEALERWVGLRKSVGSYTWAALYQQRPSPATGEIFDMGWWRYWTLDPSKVTDDGKVVLLDPDAPGRWLDSWDTAFKGAASSDFVVGQRWFKNGANRFLVAQKRGRWTFTKTLEVMRDWAKSSDDYGAKVHERLVEEAANGAAIIDTLKNEIAGLKPIKANVGKEARARAITPEIESGNVYLPLPSDPGNEWVTDLLSELRAFPHDVNDDQVDAMTQALAALRTSGRGAITVPGKNAGPGTGGRINHSVSAQRTGGGLGRRRW